MFRIAILLLTLAVGTTQAISGDKNYSPKMPYSEAVSKTLTNGEIESFRSETHQIIEKSMQEKAAAKGNAAHVAKTDGSIKEPSYYIEQANAKSAADKAAEQHAATMKADAEKGTIGNGETSNGIEQRAKFPKESELRVIDPKAGSKSIQAPQN